MKEAHGIYRVRRLGGLGSDARVTDGATEMDVPESVYRARGYRPDFDKTPWHSSATAATPAPPSRALRPPLGPPAAITADGDLQMRRAGRGRASRVGTFRAFASQRHRAPIAERHLEAGCANSCPLHESKLCMRLYARSLRTRPGDC